MQNLNLIKALNEYIKMSLSELGDSNFSLGQRHVYVEILEFVQSNLSEKERSETGLDYCIEEEYPLE